MKRTALIILVVTTAIVTYRLLNPSKPKPFRVSDWEAEIEQSVDSQASAVFDYDQTEIAEDHYDDSDEMMIDAVQESNSSVQKFAQKSGDPQENFKSSIDQFRKANQVCQGKIKKLFPENTDFQALLEKHKSPEKFTEMVSDFFGAIAEVQDSQQAFNESILGLEGSTMEGSDVFNQVSGVDVCGEFEEESIIDLALTSSERFNWTSAQKSEFVKLYVTQVKSSLNSSTGLPHIISKIDALRALADEDMVPAAAKTEIERIGQAMDQVEREFRRMIPMNMGSGTENKVGLNQVVDLKKREMEESTKLQGELSEMLQNLQYSL